MLSLAGAPLLAAARADLHPTLLAPRPASSIPSPLGAASNCSSADGDPIDEDHLFAAGYSRPSTTFIRGQEGTVGEDAQVRYRLSDMITEGRKTYPDLLQATTESWPKSLVAQYAASSSSDCNISALSDALRSVPVDPVAAEWCVLHLRVGDVIDCDPTPLEAMLRGETSSLRACVLLRLDPTTSGLAAARTCCLAGRVTQSLTRWRPLLADPTCGKQITGHMVYVQPTSYYTEAQQREFAGSCSRVHIVAGVTENRTAEQRRAGYTLGKSLAYIRLIREHFCYLGYDVTTRLGRAPDEDFAVMTQSKRYISSGGGFSELVQDVRFFRDRLLALGSGRPPPNASAGESCYVQTLLNVVVP